jgi:ribulose-phosphate 3-epimerase
MQSILVAPSVLSADFTGLDKDVRVVDARAMCAERDLAPMIEVDAAENGTTARQAAAAGATAVVAGSAIFGPRDYKAAIAVIRASAITGEAKS